MNKKKIILSDRDFTEYVKGWDEDAIHLTQDINDAYLFDSVDEAEEMRLQVQDLSGNTWGIEIFD
jgi:hypothetical protein